MDAHRVTLDEVVYFRERVLFVVMVAVSLLIYGSLGLLAFSDRETGGVIIFYGLLFALGVFLTHALAVGTIRGNGVLVSAGQFPLLHQLVLTRETPLWQAWIQERFPMPAESSKSE